MFRATFALGVHAETGEILEGELRCEKCTRPFAITRGIPRFADLGQIEKEKQETADNFGWQWTHFTQEDTLYADQFLGWLQPVTPEFVHDKVVLEGGCGKGRHTPTRRAVGRSRCYWY